MPDLPAPSPGAAVALSGRVVVADLRVALGVPGEQAARNWAAQHKVQTATRTPALGLLCPREITATLASGCAPRPEPGRRPRDAQDRRARYYASEVAYLRAHPDAASSVVAAYLKRPEGALTKVRRRLGATFNDGDWVRLSAVRTATGRTPKALIGRVRGDARACKKGSIWYVRPVLAEALVAASLAPKPDGWLTEGECATALKINLKTFVRRHRPALEAQGGIRRYRHDGGSGNQHGGVAVHPGLFDALRRTLESARLGVPLLVLAERLGVRPFTLTRRAHALGMASWLAPDARHKRAVRHVAPHDAARLEGRAVQGVLLQHLERELGLTAPNLLRLARTHNLNYGCLRSVAGCSVRDVPAETAERLRALVTPRLNPALHTRVHDFALEVGFAPGYVLRWLREAGHLHYARPPRTRRVAVLTPDDLALARQRFPPRPAAFLTPEPQQAAD